jgi:predicted TIM-barrel fold metal-dependent hydrolase
MGDTVVDIHCHVFNASDLPISGFVKYVALHGDPVSGPLADLADWILAGGTVSYADDLARVNTLLDSTGPHAVAPLTQAPAAGVVAAPDRIDAVATARLNVLHAQHPDLLARVAGAMSAINAGPAPAVPPAADAGAGIASHFDIDTVLRAVRWATLFTRSRLELAADYANAFSDAVQLAVPLLVDLGTNLGDQPSTTMAQQVELGEKISRASMLNVLPDVGGMQIHPFVGFDPLRQLNDLKTGAIQTAFDLVKSAVTDYGFIGVKVYPQMGWRPTGNTPRPGLTQADAIALDEIVESLAAWCEAEDVPLTAHCNDSNYASPDYIGMGQPAEWVRLLQDHPHLHLNLGHCGGAHANPVDYAWPDTILAAMPTYNHLYGDVGCDRIDDAATTATYSNYLTAAAAQDPTIESRLMFGTDWYMEALNADANQFLTEATNIATAAFTGPNAVANFRGGNALRFLGFDNPNNKNARRLLARYHTFSAPVPPWLTHPAAPAPHI